MNILFYHTRKQKKLAEKFIQSLEKKKEVKVKTPVKSIGTFYPAEDYHQKYYLQGNDELMTPFRKHLESFDRIVDSTTAAVVNAHLGGKLTDAELRKRLNNGVPEAEKKLAGNMIKILVPEKQKKAGQRR